MLIFQGVKRYLISEVLRLVKDDIWSIAGAFGERSYTHRKRENVHLSCWKVNSWLGGETSNLCYFHSKTLGKWSDLTFFFQMGWNHQLVDKVPWKFALCCCTWYIPWIYTPHRCGIHHQDYWNFWIGNPYKPSFVTVAGWVVDPKILEWMKIEWCSMFVFPKTNIAIWK